MRAFFQRSRPKRPPWAQIQSLGRRRRPIFLESDRSKHHFPVPFWPSNTHHRPINAHPKQTKHFFTPCFSVGKHPSTPTYDLDGSGAAMVERRGPAIWGLERPFFSIQKKGKKREHVCFPISTTTRVRALIRPRLILARSETSISGVFEVQGCPGRYQTLWEGGVGGVFTTILNFQLATVHPRGKRASYACI